MNFESRFAAKEEIFSEEFQKINTELLQINKTLQLTDHAEINNQRFSWATSIKDYPVFYASRMWEYPFAILAAELKQGMKCADIGCGTTPFTPYLCQQAGAKNVTGFDPDYFSEANPEPYYAFGIKKEFIEKAGFNFCPDDMTNLNSKNEVFDRVFCISVIEHILEPSIWQKGIKEMVRILKPGGRLIITVDLGINNPLTSPLKLIEYSGLTPLNSINLKWHKKRFATVDGNNMDVFGLVLEKSNSSIFLDYEENVSIPAYTAYKKFIPPTSSPVAIQLAIDYERPYGLLRILIKMLLCRYTYKKHS